MAVFFDFKIKPKEDGISYTQVTWHKSLPLLAVASHNEKSNVDQIDLHLDEGEDLRQSVVTKPSSINTLCWHPTRKILSSGWLNGEISNWNEHDGECNEGPIIHKSSITCLQWNGTGSRLISTDESGLLCVWKVDQRGRMQQAPLFKHAVNSPIKCLVFKLMIAADLAADIAAAAKAAVSGDETALDLFEWQKPGQSKFSIAQADSIQLFFGLKDGNVKFLDERGKCSDCFQVEGAVKYLVYYQDKDIVITITEALLLTQHTISKNNEYTETHKVKLSGQAINFCIAWAGNGLLATSCKERVARVLDVDNDQNFVLNLDGNSSFTADECITSISYSQQKGMLAGGTNKGHVAMWKYNAIREEPWELQASSDVQGVVDNLEWGTSQSLLAVNSKTSITILSQSVMNSCFNDKTAAIQMSPNQLSVETFPAGQVYDIKTDVHIKGVSCTKNHTVIWNGKKVAVYEVLESKAMVRASGTFNSDSHMIGVYEQNIYMLETDKITVRTFQGTVKQELSFLEQEGEPSDICVFGLHLCIGTNKGVLKVYDLSRREARQVGTTKYLDEAIPGFTCFECVKCNCNGSKIAFTIKTGTHVMSSYLYVWDVESDTIQCFNFELGKSSQELDDELAATQAQLTSSLKGYSPISVHWDPADPKLLACEVTKVSNNKKSFTSINQNKTTAPTESSETLGEGLVVVSMFSTPDVGLIVQDYFLVDQSVYSVLLGIDMPHFYFVKSNKNAENMTKKSHVIQKTFRDFIGLEDADASVLKAMSDFSYLSAVGNMDEAFKAIKTIKSGSVWENMARMCVKTKRLDVAMVCLGNMGNPGAAKAVRECQKQESELNAHIAMLAIQIGMNDEAEKLYKECKRYDLLNQFYQASDNWKQAIECAESHDRIHLRTTYYNYGKYLESYGNIPNAILQYERSDTHKFEVPRMLFEQQEKLEAYITKQKDSNLYKWWAQYNESIGEMDTALHYYELSKEYLSMVRVLCYCNNLERASQLCNDIGDKAACYHLARQYESNSDAKNAIHYFSRAHSYSNAIRLAKESEMDNELVSLALLSTQENMLDCARYFEIKEDMADKAVLLYHKGGSVSKAIDLAFKTQQFGALQLISEDLDENADPEILRQCAEFFIQHDQYDRAVNLLVVAKRFDEALTMCEDHHIDLTEELAEKMTPSKDDSMGSNERNALLEKIGECAYRQGSLHLATKKFTQAGNRVKAMKALLKSGDTEKIIFFAGVSRQREIYVMAANYLQSLDWRRDPEIMKNIISFYTKGRSLESLSSFYDACAQVEIDEFQNYEKAFGALSESYKCLSKSKSKNSGQHEERLALIKTRLTQMKAYIQAKKSYEINPDESIQECLQLLTEPDLSSSVRVGDVYGFVVQHYFAAQNHDQAYQIIEDMRSRYPKLKLRNYISVKIIEQVHKQVGVPYHGDQQRNGISNGQMESDGEDLDEEIEENDTDDYI